VTDSRVLRAMPEPRRAILTALKGSGPLSMAQLADRVGTSYEAIRQQMSQLELEGWVSRKVDRRSATPGRPRSLYRLTAAGDHLFPKEYDDLAVALLDAVSERMGGDAVRSLLAEVTRRKVEAWEPLLRDKSLEERVEALRDIYLEDDPFTRVEREDRSLRLVERNCPFLSVAKRRPALCSVTVSVLRRLLGCEVVRRERFQEGDGRCVFEVFPDRPVAPEAEEFDWEPEPGEGESDWRPPR
jgi:predicted ArsR family transcriptional regulator